MQLGIIGLGRMGGNIARRLMLNGHTTVVFDRNTDFVSALEQEGATGVTVRPLCWANRGPIEKDRIERYCVILMITEIRQSMPPEPCSQRA